MRTIKIFAEARLSELLEQRREELRREVQNEAGNRLLNVNESEYIQYAVSRFRLEPLAINFDGVNASTAEKMIRAEHFPSNFNVYSGKTYPKQVITYHLPFTGDQELLRRQPSSHIMWTTEVRLDSGAVRFDVINWRDDPSEIQREADSTISRIRTLADSVAKDVEGFNCGLEDEARQIVQVRKASLLKQSNVLASLGVPLRKVEAAPATFSVPITPRRVVVTTAKPEAPNTPFKPEPSLDDSSYHEILRMLSDIGREMERHPRVYSDKDEETLRDHFIMVLTPQFQSVSGETFNKQGKTDILVRHDGANIFVAECKFWRGPKGHQDTIDQLLSYLTWRDSKTAIMLFVDNKDFQQVLNQIPTETAKHPCFVKDHGTDGEARFRFEFRLPDDQHRRVWATVLCFHFPQRQ